MKLFKRLKEVNFLRASRAKERIIANLWRTLLIVSILAAWEIMVRKQLLDTFYFSQPTAIFTDLKKLFLTGEIFPHINITLQEAFLGLIIGTIMGVGVAFVLGRFESVARVLDPVIMALYGIPKLALGPLFILWFGLGIESKVFISFISVFFLTFFNAYGGFKSVDPSLVDTIRLMGATGSQIISKVVLPSCVPWILTGLRGSLGAALLGAIVGEYIGSNSGLGWMVENAGGMFDTTRVLSTIVVMTVIMMLLNEGVNVLEKRLLKWRPLAD